MDQTLDFDHIPIERAWELSLYLHDCLPNCGEPWEWEICDRGCDKAANDIIRILFGAPIH
jgi:hypothetical protein